ncbi:MAG: hypothetical protein KY467_01170 [Gemmatimonadetes bacterium]|nr:hypothetical protein [Gemmatimonadota bacterium]
MRTAEQEHAKVERAVAQLRERTRRPSIYELEWCGAAYACLHEPLCELHAYVRAERERRGD